MLELMMILGGIVMRLLPHLPNFSSISATALFGGRYLKKRYAFVLPLIALAVSDYLLLYINPFGEHLFNFSTIQPVSAMFHSTTLYVWGSFMISGGIGLWLRKHHRLSHLLLASLVATLQFFIITNFAVWAGGAYDRSLSGLWMSYYMGLPFLKWTMLGDLFYTGVFFGSCEMAKRFALTGKHTLDLA